VTSFANFPKLVVNSGGMATSDAAIVIDSSADGTSKKWLGLLEKTWAARIDTLAFGDGPLIVHYIVMDQAGNATHYRKDIYIENKRPRITSINLGTDIRGDGSSEFMPNPTAVYLDSRGGGKIQFENPAFRVRNKLFNVSLTIEKGTDARWGTVSYVTPNGIIPAAQMKRGRVYTIETTGNTDFTLYGAPVSQQKITFVASDVGVGTGTVTQYTERITKKVSFGTDGGSPSSVSIPFDTFSVTTPVPYTISDSHKNASGDVDIHNEKLFIVQVYDSAVPAGAGGGNPHAVYDQLAHAVLVAVDLDNTDQKAPSINVLPFGEEYYMPIGADPANDGAKQARDLSDADYTKNIATANSEKLGFVQYAKHSMPAVANISGKVIFLGKAADNQRIDKIYVTIPGYDGGAGTAGAKFLIAEMTGGTLTPLTPAGNYTNHWSFEVLDGYDKLTLNYGHAINWRFTWDSSKRANGSSTVTFEVRDAANLTSTGQVAVNIVPYISEIETPLCAVYPSMPSAFARSSTGGYPIAEGSDIYIRGFNFGASPIVTIGGSGANGALQTADLLGSSNYYLAVTKVASTDTSHFRSTVDTFTGKIANATALKSGELRVTNGIASINDSTNVAKTIKTDNKTVVFDAPYNQEANGVNNDILDNRRYILIWDVGTMFTQAAGYEFKFPFSRVDPNGNWYISSAERGTSSTTAELRVRKNGVSQRNGANNDYVQQYANRFYYTTIAYDANGNWYTAATNATSNTNGHKFGVWSLAGNNSVYERVITQANSFAQDRFQIPRLALNGTTVHMSYYDRQAGTVLYRSGGMTTPTGNIATAPATTLNNSTYREGVYNAVGYAGKAVVAWFDETRKCLVLYNGTGRRLVTAVNSNRGAHVDMAVDGNNDVHLAFYDVTSGGLYYAFIANGSLTFTGDSDVLIGTVYKVDTYLNPGTNLMINVREEVAGNYVPYITYMHGAFRDTTAAVRIAWRNTSMANLTHGTLDNDRFNGSWEVMTVPIEKAPVDGFICHGLPLPTANIPAWTLSPGSTLLPSNSRGSILVGYPTVTTYEGAILKK
jgi:hypothetical protein